MLGWFYAIFYPSPPPPCIAKGAVTVPKTKSLKIYEKIALKKNGLFWVSWPKGSSKIKTELNRDLIREYLIKIGLVDVKVVAIDQDWSGLKFVYRLIDR